MRRHNAFLNRFGLGLVGLLLLAGGVLAFARGTGGLGRTRPHEPILGDGVRGYVAGEPWFWQAVALAAVVLALFALVWLVAQGRRDTLSRVEVDREGAGITRMPASAVTGAIGDEVAEYPDVVRGRAALLRPAGRPALRLDLTVGERADVRPTIRRLHDEALPRLRQALDADRLPTVVRIRTTARQTANPRAR
ncbi:MAG: alkaline shock response membrane anchor protein AmaP [Streptosporangiales bacterium]|nr:alkaline shock response membrane anchor protein AmaP [Streptosporangiales bacterium]